MKIRNAITSDKSRCLHLLDLLNNSASEAAEQIFDALLDTSRGQIIVAEHENKIIGMASVSYNLAMRYGGEYCQLEELIVDPEARGLNAGGSLVAATIDNASTRGCAEYGLYLIESTEHNQPFYEKYGLLKVGSEMRLAIL
ncbi:MAG: GNAT family N-acetyltransferase [bacterium]|nr:N-acetyltransferase [Gammaproteobacteria bacterium]HIL98235.1 N-acetyltransferase [Pseudomonadales bacterium]